ncbi:MAG: glycosyltransferase [bacterium]|nr:glycosyltransferase [bacterium]
MVDFNPNQIVNGSSELFKTLAISPFENNLNILKQKFPRVAGLILEAKPSSDEATIVDTAEGPAVFLNGIPLDHPDKPATAALAWATRSLGEDRYKEAKNIIIYGFGAGYHVDAFLKQSKARIIVIEPSIEALKAAISVRDLRSVFLALKDLCVGRDFYPENLPDGIELIIRPQSQSSNLEHCHKVKTIAFSKRGFTALHPKVGILGPLQGGTLPIAGYCERGLGLIKQRTHAMDVSGFAPGYHEFSKFLKQDQRKSVLEGHYLQMLSTMLVESLTEHPVDILLCMAQAPISGAALQELRRRGVITVLWFVEDYLRFTYWREMAKYYDFVFTIQKGPCIDAIRAAGAGEVHYLPLGADPYVHTPLTLSPEDKQRWGSPISFVGAGYHNRQHVFANLMQYPVKLWGTEWPTCKPFSDMVQESGRRLAPEEYVKIFNATDININLHSSAERNDVDPFGDFVNPRTFELAACGAFQLVDNRSLLAENFEPGKEVATFQNSADLKEKLNYYIDRPEERAQMAALSRKRVLKDHTYEARLKQMLAYIFGTKFEHLREREILNPWTNLIRRAEKHPELLDRCKVAYDRGELPKLDGLVADIMTGKGKLSDTEKKLLFLHHIKSQIVSMKKEGGH